MQIVGFDWDQGNTSHCRKHRVSLAEIEACFASPVMIEPDPYPVEIEKRFNAVGDNGQGRHVFIVFTIRQTTDGKRIRPISARYMHRKEIERYEQRQQRP